MSAVLASPDKATLQPSEGWTVAPEPTSFEPSWLQVGPLVGVAGARVKSHAAPTYTLPSGPLSFGPPTSAVLPSADKPTP
ncbi:MAG: hypothetical protein ACXVXL_30500 [Solirubrobacteraceae bacterium]